MAFPEAVLSSPPPRAGERDERAPELRAPRTVHR